MSTQNQVLAHDQFFNELFEKEYKRIDDNKQLYLDYTGGNLHAKSQLDAHFQLLNDTVLGNPHSINPTSLKATKLVEAARNAVISFFNAEDYHCIFTQNASGALKIVGECYPFDEKGGFLLLADNHNSVNGIREYCKNKKGKFQYASIQYEDLKINEEELGGLLSSSDYTSNKLFAFPAQSNVSGIKHDLSWVEKAQKLGWDVLLDAAAYVPTNKLDLKLVQPEYVSMSFYKMFGYPTGIGCLMVRKDKFDKLLKPWFAGGTVTMVGVKSPNHYLINNHERFENGTINYLDIPAVHTGINFLNDIGMERITERINALANYLYTELKALKHDNGKEVIKIFGPQNRAHTGSNMILNFFDQNAKLYPFELIEQDAARKNISIRSGCFCNPGIDEVNSCLTLDELSNYFSSRDDGNYHDMIQFLKKMRGATRVSVGLATRKKDIDAFVDFAKSFMNTEIPESASTDQILA